MDRNKKNLNYICNSINIKIKIFLNLIWILIKENKKKYPLIISPISIGFLLHIILSFKILLKILSSNKLKNNQNSFKMLEWKLIYKWTLKHSKISSNSKSHKSKNIKNYKKSSNSLIILLTNKSQTLQKDTKKLNNYLNNHYKLSDNKKSIISFNQSNWMKPDSLISWTFLSLKSQKLKKIKSLKISHKFIMSNNSFINLKNKLTNSSNLNKIPQFSKILSLLHQKMR